MTWSTCMPHPDQVTLPQDRHVAGLHIGDLVSSGLVDQAYPRGYSARDTPAYERTPEMCRQVTCRKCGNATWAGCGQHVDQVMRGVPKSKRCACPPTPSLVERLFGGRKAKV